MKIRMVREIRGLSQDTLATMVGISQNTLSQYENNQIKISAETLEKLASALDVSPMDLMNQQPAIINLQPNQGTQGINHIENFYNTQKEFIDKMFASKDEEIARLQKIIDSLLEKK